MDDAAHAVETADQPQGVETATILSIQQTFPLASQEVPPGDAFSDQVAPSRSDSDS